MCLSKLSGAYEKHPKKKNKNKETLLLYVEQERLKQATLFENIADAMNVPLESVLLETDSCDIIAAIANSHRMLTSLGLTVRSLIVVHLPFMERLVQLTFQHSWPGKFKVDQI